MKKLLISALALTMGVTCAFGLAACGGEGGDNQGMTDAEIANAAINNLKVLYASNKVEETPRDYQVLGKVKVQDDLYNVSWSVSAETNDISDYITVGAMDEEYMVTISVTKPPVATEYTLTASVTVGDETASYGFAKSVPAAVDVDTGDRDTVEASIVFDDAAKRTTFTDEVQVWEQNGIKVTNYAGSTAIGNFINPARFYKGSTVIIEYPGIKHIEIDSSIIGDSDYTTPIKTTIANNNVPATVTITDEHVVIDLDIAVDYLELVAAGQFRMYAMDIIAVEGGANDAEKVAAAEAMLTIGQTYSATGNYELPTQSYGANITWSVKETTDLVSIVDGKLSVDKLPEVETTLTLVAAIECGGAKGNVEITITVYPDLGLGHAGTAEDPFTPAEVVELITTVDDYYRVGGEVVAICVEGYIVETGSWASQYNNWQGVYISSDPNGSSNSEDAVQIYGLIIDGTYIKSQADLVKGSKIVVSGALQKYKDTAEITFYNALNIKAQAIAYEKADGTGTNPGTDPKPTESEFNPITTPVAGEYDAMAMDINGTWYYMTGALSGNYAASTTNAAEAAKMELIEDGDGWLIKANGKYVEIIISGTYNNIKFNDARETDIHWVWNTTHNIFTWTNANDTFWMGTYSTYTTFSASKISYITNANQYPAKLGNFGEGTGSNPGTDPKPTESEFNPITTPVAGEYDAIAMDINGTWYYMTGALSGNYAASTTNAAEAAKMELIEDGDGWLIKANGNYVEIVVSGTYNNIKFNAERATDIHWVWNTTHNIFTWTNANDTFWMGTYSTYTTFSASKISYITNANQYPAKLGNFGEGTGSNPGTDPGTDPGDDVAAFHFEKITSLDQLVSGAKYLIVYEKGNLVFNGSITNLDSEGNRIADVTISGAQIAGTEALKNSAFVIEEVSGGYSIKSASGLFIGNTSDANSLKTSSSAYTNTITFDAEGNADIVSAATHLRYNNAASNGTRFRYYKSTSYTSQQAIQLYILVED